MIAAMMQIFDISFEEWESRENSCQVQFYQTPRDGFDAIETGSSSRFFFCETKSGVFLISRKDVERLEL